MSFALTAAQEELRAKARDLAERVIAPRAVEVAHNLVTAAGAALFGVDAGQFEGMRKDTAAEDGVEVADGRL